MIRRASHRLSLLDFSSGGDECLHYWRIKTPWFGVRLHHWIREDREEFSHDHRWAFVTFVMKGGYVDRSRDAQGGIVDDRLRAPCVRYRRAEHEHTVLDCAGCWTLVIMGRPVRRESLYIAGKAVGPAEWFGRVCGR